MVKIYQNFFIIMGIMNKTEKKNRDRIVIMRVLFSFKIDFISFILLLLSLDLLLLFTSPHIIFHEPSLFS